MKLLLLSLLISTAGLSSAWQTDFTLSQKIAHEKRQLIVLNFSGSDWCGPCMRMRKEIFESDVFKTYADSNLVLINADFPRLKKNHLSKEQTEKNEQLADKYNTGGSFPLTLILNADGKVLRTYDGFPAISPTAFINEIKEAVNAAN